MGVVVKPVQTINVRVNQGIQPTVPASTIFVGAGNYGPQINAASEQAALAYAEANAAYALANSVSGTANAALSTANAAYYLANSVSGTANAAYAQANLAYYLANSAYYLASNVDGGISF